MEEQSRHDKIIAQCFKIIELWREGYSDAEIRGKLGMSVVVFNDRLKKIREEDIVGTETVMLFEKEAVKLHALYRKSWDQIDGADPRLIPALLRTCLEIRKALVDIAQKLGAVDPQRIVIEHLNQERAELKDLSTEDLTNRFFQQLNKPTATRH